MTERESDFLSDVEDAIEDWDYEIEHYHENGYFCVDITFDDDDDYHENSDEIWDAISEVCNDWGAGYDHHSNEYYLSIEEDD